MATILFLDDDTNRSKSFAMRMIGHRLTIVETASDCIEYIRQSLLKNEPFDLICLDHDLGGKQFVNSKREDTGMEVVRWLCATPNSTKSPVLVHSYNVPAAKIMVRELSNSGYWSQHSLFGADEFYRAINTIITQKKDE